jgi:hypothetical protein
MRKLLAGLAFGLAMLVAVPAFAADPMYVDVRNDTGFVFWHLHVSPVTAKGWEEDLLGETEVMEVGATKRVTLDGYTSPMFDVRAIDYEGDAYERRGVNVLEEDVTFTLSDLVTD